MVRSLYVTLVLLIVTPRIGVNYTNKQSHVVSVLSLVFSITIPYKYLYQTQATGETRCVQRQRQIQESEICSGKGRQDRQGQIP